MAFIRSMNAFWWTSGHSQKKFYIIIILSIEWQKTNTCNRSIRSAMTRSFFIVCFNFRFQNNVVEIGVFIYNISVRNNTHNIVCWQKPNCLYPFTVLWLWWAHYSSQSPPAPRTISLFVFSFFILLLHRNRLKSAIDCSWHSMKHRCASRRVRSMAQHSE